MICPATNADAEAVTHLVFSVLKDYGLKPDPETTDADLKDLEASYHGRGGCFDLLRTGSGVLIGTVGIYPLDKGRCELRKMYLHPSEQGKGLGKMLLKHALNRARALGFTTVVLETASVLREATDLYQKYGFVPYTPEHLSERCDQAFIKHLADTGQGECGVP